MADRPSGPYIVDVTSIVDAPGHRKAEDRTVPTEGVTAGLVEVPAGTDIRFDLAVECITGGIVARGTVSGRYAGTCRRCLAPFERPFSFEAAELYRPKGEEWEEGYRIEMNTIDLEPLVGDVVVLSLPSNPLCSDDCQGLCPTCGQDRRQDPCTCATDDTDPRWAALDQLETLPERKRVP